MSSSNALNQVPFSASRRSSVLRLIFALRATLLEMDGPLGEPFDDQFSHVVDDVPLLRSRAQDLLAGALEHFEERAVGTDHRQIHRVVVVDQGIPVGMKSYRAAEIVGVGDLAVGSPMHELRAQRRYALARQISGRPARLSQLCTLNCVVAPGGPVGFAEAQHDVRSRAHDLDILALADNPAVALDVAESVEQRGRVEHDEAEHPRCSRASLCRAQAQPVADVAKGLRRAFDEGEHCGVRDAVVGVQDVPEPQADFLEENVRDYAAAPEVTDDLGRQASIDPVRLRHVNRQTPGFLVATVDDTTLSVNEVSAARAWGRLLCIGPAQHHREPACARPTGRNTCAGRKDVGAPMAVPDRQPAGSPLKSGDNDRQSSKLSSRVNILSCGINAVEACCAHNARRSPARAAV